MTEDIVEDPSPTASSEDNLVLPEPPRQTSLDVFKLAHALGVRLSKRVKGSVREFSAKDAEKRRNRNKQAKASRRKNRSGK